MLIAFRFLIAGAAAIGAGLLITFNEVAGGPLRGVPVMLLGALVVCFGARSLHASSRTARPAEAEQVELDPIQRG